MIGNLVAFVRMIAASVRRRAVGGTMPPYRPNGDTVRVRLSPGQVLNPAGVAAIPTVTSSTPPDPPPPPGGRGCCSTGFNRLLDHLAENLEAHADRDGLTGPARAVFLARGGHAPGTQCPTAPPLVVHDMRCDWLYSDDGNCVCGADR